MVYARNTCMHLSNCTHHDDAHTHACTHSDISRLKPIKELLPDTISYGDIHLTIAIITVMTGFVRPPRSYYPHKQSPPFTQPSSSAYTPSPALNHSVSEPSYNYVASSGSSSSKSWGGGNWHQKKGTKRKLPPSFRSGSYSGYGGKHKAKSKKFW